MKTESELRELDAYIAQHLMGWKRTDKPDNWTAEKVVQFYIKPDGACIVSTPWTSSAYPPNVWAHSWSAYTPTTDPAAAMQVLEKCADECLVQIRRQSDQSWCVWGDTVDSNGETIPLAIALFAKALHENK
jgi:hypothetical protein